MRSSLEGKMDIEREILTGSGAPKYNQPSNIPTPNNESALQAKAVKFVGTSKYNELKGLNLQLNCSNLNDENTLRITGQRAS